MGREAILLDGFSLTCRTLSRLGAKGSKIGLSSDASHRIKQARDVVDRLVERGFSEGHVAYGINTGFGLFADVIIENSELVKLQQNLIRSHSCGVGEPLSPEETRRLLALRINVLAKGHSGIRPETVERMIAAFNNDCLSIVPSQGTVGASGDLAPLSVSRLIKSRLHVKRTLSCMFTVGFACTLLLAFGSWVDGRRRDVGS